MTYEWKHARRAVALAHILGRAESVEIACGRNTVRIPEISEPTDCANCGEPALIDVIEAKAGGVESAIYPTCACELDEADLEDMIASALHHRAAALDDARYDAALARGER